MGGVCPVLGPLRLRTDCLRRKPSCSAHGGHSSPPNSHFQGKPLIWAGTAVWGPDKARPRGTFLIRHTSTQPPNSVFTPGVDRTPMVGRCYLLEDRGFSPGVDKTLKVGGGSWPYSECPTRCRQGHGESGFRSSLTSPAGSCRIHVRLRAAGQRALDRGLRTLTPPHKARLPQILLSDPGVPPDPAPHTWGAGGQVRPRGRGCGDLTGSCPLTHLAGSHAAQPPPCGSGPLKVEVQSD